MPEGGGPTFVLVMIGSIVFNYAMALAVEASVGRLHRLILAVSVAGNLCLLGGYKYLNFLTATVRRFFPGLQEAVPQTSVLRALSVSLVFVIFVLCTVLPHAGSLSVAGRFYRTMFDLSSVSGESLFWIREYWYVFLAAIVGSFPVWEGVRRRGLLAAGHAIQLVLAVVSVMSLLMENNNPFLYFAF